MIVTRVEKHILKQNNEYYSLIDDFCLKAKNLYNHANYIIRQEFCSSNKWIRYSDLDSMLKKDKDYPDYANMPTAQSAQQILRLLDKNWTSFFKSIKDWSKHKDKYLGRPKLPKYKSKNGREILILTNQNVKLKENILSFPKTFNKFTIQPQFVNRTDFVSFQQARFLPRNKHIVIELVYNIEIPNIVKDNGRYLSIDIGVDNLSTITNNFNETPVIVNGKGLKSMNQYYNKMISHYREVAKRMNDSDFTNRMAALTRKRNHKIDDYMHKASRYVIEYAVSMGTNTIVIGNNKEWKQESKLSKVVNQSFVGIPQKRFIEMIQYKAQNIGLNVVLQEESYTSGTSFLDKEEPVKANYDKSRRVTRGLFVSNKGIRINADVNGSYQILMKVFPNAFAEGIEGVALHPIRVNVA